LDSNNFSSLLPLIQIPKIEFLTITMTAKPKSKRRDLILTMALKLFNEQGSHKVTTNHIAKAMGINPGNLYYHFKNKEHP